MSITSIPTSRIALITGGSRGLGKSMALALADHGVDVVVTYRKEAAEAQAVAGAITAKGRKAAALALDVGDVKTFPAFVETLRRELESRWGRAELFALVNNAGMGLHAPFSETTEEQFDAVMNVHLKGAFFLTQRLLPLLVDGGRILNVSTGLARFSLPGYAAYATMKGGVEVLTRYLAKELGPRRISVNVLAPGAIATDFGGGAVRDDPQVNQFVASVTAQGRAGQPEDIGGAVAMLLSPEMEWMTGQRIELSGGMFL